MTRDSYKHFEMSSLVEKQGIRGSPARRTVAKPWNGFRLPPWGRSPDRGPDHWIGVQETGVCLQAGQGFFAQNFSAVAGPVVPAFFSIQGGGISLIIPGDQIVPMRPPTRLHPQKHSELPRKCEHFEDFFQHGVCGVAWVQMGARPRLPAKK